MVEQESSIAPPATLGVENGRLLDSRPCRKCQYDLRGAEVAGVCPECAKPVVESLSGALLKYSERDYVQRLLRGNAFATNGLLAVILGSMAVSLFTAMDESQGEDLTIGLLTLGAALVVLLGAFSIAIGWWIIVGQENGDPASRVVRLRQWVRISALTYALALGLASVAGFLEGYMETETPILSPIATIISTVAWIGVFYFGARYVRIVTNRVPDRKAERQSGALANVLLYVLAAYALAAIGIAWALVAPPENVRAELSLPLVLIMAGGLGAGMLSLIALIRYARLSSRLRKGLKSVLRQMETA